MSDWSTFASTLLDNVPLDLFIAAESEAEQLGLDAHSAFLEWHSFTEWCNDNLNVTDRDVQAKQSIQSLKQTGSVAAYKAAFDSLKVRAGNPGMHLFWWNQGLKPVIQQLTAIDFKTSGPYTVLADAQRAALAVESARMGGPATPAFASDPSSSSRQPLSNLGNRGPSSAKGYKFRQTLPPQQQTRPTAAAPHNRGTAASAVHKVPSMASKNPNMLAYMRRASPKAAVVPAAIAKPVHEQHPGTCWVKGCNPSTTLHTRWQECPRASAWFKNPSGFDEMDTVTNPSAHIDYKPPPPSSRR